MKTFIFLFLLVCSPYCIAIDMEKYRQDTNDLINMEEYEEALKRTIWFHNHALEHRRSLYGVRLSFALSNWYDLGKKYPPALEALKKTRDDKTKSLITGTGNPELFHDVISINRTLSEKNKSIELFRNLDEKQPELAKKSWHFAKDLIIKSKDYGLVNKYIGNILVEYARNEMRFIEMSEFYKKNKEEFGSQQQGFANDHYIKQTTELLTIAKQLNNPKAAEFIIKKASIIVDEYNLGYDFTVK